MTFASHRSGPEGAGLSYRASRWNGVWGWPQFTRVALDDPPPPHPNPSLHRTPSIAKHYPPVRKQFPLAQYYWLWSCPSLNVRVV